MLLGILKEKLTEQLPNLPRFISTQGYFGRNLHGWTSTWNGSLKSKRKLWVLRQSNNLIFSLHGSFSNKTIPHHQQLNLHLACFFVPQINKTIRISALCTIKRTFPFQVRFEFLWYCIPLFIRFFFQRIFHVTCTERKLSFILMPVQILPTKHYLRQLVVTEIFSVLN